MKIQTISNEIVMKVLTNKKGEYEHYKFENIFVKNIATPIIRDTITGEIVYRIY
jgi:hypothetical protein